MPGTAEFALHGADIDDLTTAALDHGTSHGLAGEERAFNVHPHEFTEFFRWEIFQRSSELHARVVEENIYRANVRFDTGDGLCNTFLGGHIEIQPVNLEALCAQCCNCAIKFGPVAAVQNNFSACCCQPFGDGKSNALT